METNALRLSEGHYRPLLTRTGVVLRSRVLRVQVGDIGCVALLVAPPGLIVSGHLAPIVLGTQEDFPCRQSIADGHHTGRHDARRGHERHQPVSGPLPANSRLTWVSLTVSSENVLQPRTYCHDSEGSPQETAKALSGKDLD